MAAAVKAKDTSRTNLARLPLLLSGKSAESSSPPPGWQSLLPRGSLIGAGPRVLEHGIWSALGRATHERYYYLHTLASSETLHSRADATSVLPRASGGRLCCRSSSRVVVDMEGPGQSWFPSRATGRANKCSRRRLSEVRLLNNWTEGQT